MQAGAPLSFWTLKGKRKEEKHSTAREPEREREDSSSPSISSFQASSPRNCNQDAGYWVSLATHTAPLRRPAPTARAQGSLSGNASPLRSGFKRKGVWAFYKNPHFDPGQPETLQGEEAWQKQRRREVLVSDRPMMGMLTPCV